MTPATKMVEVRWPKADSCANAKCRKRIPASDLCFLDVLWERVYCHACGLCLRYSRKRAMQRGEPIENGEIS
ncbi:MAG: hypothetical protein A3E01_18535 [Gammaproteobacteria bacterium RIFCSPHIGHO2_12_FULL_63_22]|nr:MAG: hypothetical protein A3E01_18535 [Gammaproteobacteria bacterium RIFCSPHIGHO2_12_FULL_63_22]